MERRGPDNASEREVARRVSLRLARQAVLTREPDPLVLSVVLDESVLLRVAGNEDVMRGQLDRLLRDARSPRIHVRVLPLRLGEFSGGFGSFSVLTAPESDQPYMAYVRDRSGPHYLERPWEVQAHIELFNYLEDVVLSHFESLVLIDTVNRERYQ